MKKKVNKLPDFDKMTREEEAKWFDTHDMGDYWDELDDVKVIIDLEKPKEETLVVRMQGSVKEKLGKIAQNKGLSPSTLARMWIIEKLHTAS